MTDKELIYNYLNKNYRINYSLDKVMPDITDINNNIPYSMKDFMRTFFNIIGDYHVSDSETSFEIMLDWYTEKISMIEEQIKMYQEEKIRMGQSNIRC